MKMIGSGVFALAAMMVIPLNARANETDVRKMLADYVDVFNQKGAEKVGQFWTENGTHTDRETGKRTEGREAIQKDIAEVMKDESGIKLSATIERLKFITPVVASVEGETTVVLSDAEPVVSAYTAIVVHQDGKWLLDSIEDMPLPQPASSTAALKQLQWLIGDWVDESGDVKVTTTFRWSANQAFLLRSFNVETNDGVAMQGTQVIGWDPIELQIRSWSFNSDGSFGQSIWSSSGDGWSSKTVNTLSSGESASGNYVMERLSDDAFTIQLVGHEIGGQPQPTGPASKLVRVAEQSATVPSTQN